MNHIKHGAVLLCILFFSSFLCGCWNYIDVDTEFVVMGVIIDQDKKTGEYIIISEVSKAKGGSDPQLITRVESSKGITLFDATRNSIMKIGSKLYWGHTMVYIISESVAKEGIADVMSLLSRQTQIRSDIFVLIAEDDSVNEIFEFKDPIHEDISEHLHDLLETHEASGKFRRTPLYKILQELASQEMSLMLPFIKMVDKNADELKHSVKSNEEDDKSKDAEEDNESKDAEEDDKSKDAEEDKNEQILVVDGSAIFKGDKMVGRLDGVQSRSALILKSEVEKNYVISLEETANIPKCAIEAISSSVKISPIIQDEETLVININLKIEGDIVELQSLVDFIADDKKKELENAFENLLEQQLHDAIKKAQAVDSDIIGFAGITHIKQQALWKSISDIWDEVYKNIECDISVKVVISSSSLSMNPIKVGK